MNRIDISNLFKNGRLAVIDGSMSTALEHMGANLNNKLWTASALAEQPQLVKQVHYDYFKAGADCGITCSYQATIPGLINAGYTEDQAREIIASSVKVFIEARDQWWEEEGKNSGRPYPVCLAGIGPYGAYLADGSEYTGNYNVSDEELYAFHKERMEILWNAGADVILIETQPSLHEVLIEAQIAEELGAPYWISFSCRDGHRTNKNETMAECMAALSENHPNLKVVGVNCTKPEHIDSLIRELKRCTDLPVAVYPNSGEIYDPKTKSWHGNPDAKSFYEYALSYYRSGADAVGGCCTTVASHVAQVLDAKEAFEKSGRKGYIQL